MIKKSRKNIYGEKLLNNKMLEVFWLLRFHITMEKMNRNGFLDPQTLSVGPRVRLLFPGFPQYLL